MSKHNPYVTASGRAVTCGVQTRKSLDVRRVHMNQNPPLPLHLQVRPAPFVRTPEHPFCSTDTSHVGHLMALLGRLTPMQFILGFELDHADEHEWQVQIRGVVRGSTYYPQFALGYARAASYIGLPARLIRRTK